MRLITFSPGKMFTPEFVWRIPGRERKQEGLSRKWRQEDRGDFYRREISEYTYIHGEPISLAENDRRLRSVNARSYTGYKQQTPAWQESVRVRHATDEVDRSSRSREISLKPRFHRRFLAALRHRDGRRERFRRLILTISRDMEPSRETRKLQRLLAREREWCSNTGALQFKHLTT